MKKRIFIAINLPENIKGELLKHQEEINSLFRQEKTERGVMRWTKKENLHITLVFIGYVDDETVYQISRKVKEIASKHHSFYMNLKNICYGPPAKMPPRMVWAEAEGKEAASLKNDLEKTLIDSGVDFLRENKGFKLHITLGRINAWTWKRIEPEERPEIDREVSLSFNVNSIEVMESVLKRGGAQYTIIESDRLGLSK